MKNTKTRHWLRKCCVLGIIALSGFLTQCTSEPPPPPAPEPQKSLVDQYKDTSKESAANPGVAGSPGTMKEEGKKEGE